MLRNCFTIWCSMGPRQIMACAGLEIYRNHLQAVRLASLDAILSDHLRLTGDSSMSGVRTVNVGVKQANFVPHLPRARRVHRQRGLSHSTFGPNYARMTSTPGSGLRSCAG